MLMNVHHQCFSGAPSGWSRLGQDSHPNSHPNYTARFSHGPTHMGTHDASAARLTRQQAPRAPERPPTPPTVPPTTTPWWPRLATNAQRCRSRDRRHCPIWSKARPRPLPAESWCRSTWLRRPSWPRWQLDMPRRPHGHPRQATLDHSGSVRLIPSSFPWRPQTRPTLLPSRCRLPPASHAMRASRLHPSTSPTRFRNCSLPRLQPARLDVDTSHHGPHSAGMRLGSGSCRLGQSCRRPVDIHHRDRRRLAQLRCM